MFYRMTLLGVAVLVLGGCFAPTTPGQPVGPGQLVAPVQPPLGGIYGRHKAPLNTNFEQTDLGSKTGTAVVRYFRDPLLTGLPFASWGDASIERAAANGQITDVKHTDYEVMNLLGIYVQFTVHAYGD